MRVPAVVCPRHSVTTIHSAAPPTTTHTPPPPGNDFSTIFAPLVRDGRMDKFYWQPTEEDLVGILHQVGRALASFAELMGQGWVVDHLPNDLACGLLLLLLLRYCHCGTAFLGAVCGPCAVLACPGAQHRLSQGGASCLCRPPGVPHVPQMYKDDGLSESDMAALLRAFPGQTLDFFGALR